MKSKNKKNKKDNNKENIIKGFEEGYEDPEEANLKEIEKLKQQLNKKLSNEIVLDGKLFTDIINYLMYMKNTDSYAESLAKRLTQIESIKDQFKNDADKKDTKEKTDKDFKLFYSDQSSDDIFNIHSQLDDALKNLFIVATELNPDSSKNDRKKKFINDLNKFFK